MPFTAFDSHNFDRDIMGSSKVCRATETPPTSLAAIAKELVS
jgi:hypothetical protein